MVSASVSGSKHAYRRLKRAGHVGTDLLKGGCFAQVVAA